MLLFPGAWHVSGLGHFGPSKFIPVSTSIPICDVKLEAFLAGNHTNMYMECAVIGAPYVARREPCMGNAAVTVEPSLRYHMYRASCGYDKQGCEEVGRYLGNLWWFGLMISREDAFVVLQKLSSSCENTPSPAFRAVRSLVASVPTELTGCS